ncbi:TRAP transporter large permease [Marispirochaeta sp.]|uniref:TRAP transporter large permease n=1 Tax=Marispirochaeta sp. TaxID=2038653 RepID=UPI0029C8C520|nr:TRAP transporter large permease [Marispirochaeta sp.]
MILFLTLGLVIFLLMGMPVALALGLSSIGALISGGMIFQASIIAQKMQFGLQNFILLAIPLFILAAKLMNTAGITQKIFGFADTLVGFLPGGLAHANVVASLIFAGMSGAAVVDAAGLGQIELDAMEKGGYPKPFAVAVTCASSTIGPIFPPSLPFVVFSFVSGVSVGRLFLGGVVPGVLMTVILMLMVAFYSKKHKYPRQPFPTWKTALTSFLEALLPLFTPIILLGGIWLGFVTPTEAAAVAVCYALFIGVVVLQELSWRDLVQAFYETAKETAMIGFVVAASTLYGWVLMRSGMTIRMAEWLISISDSALVILFIINIFLLIVGCFLDSTVAILILGPILMPVIQRLGIDPVHFGVIMVLNLMIGLLTPPFGIVLFVMAEVSKLKFEKVVYATLPFLIPLFVVLILIVIFPGLVTWLPNLVMGLG